MTFTTAYLCDSYSGRENLQIAEAVLTNFGGKDAFGGLITTIRCFEDNVLINKALSEKADNRVLVVDAGGSRRCSLIDAKLASIALENGWQGIVIYGCVRDTALLQQIPIGICALHAHPLLCHGKDSGDRDILVTFGGINFRKDHFLFADNDGIIVSETMLS
jgi:regulator of ribonuclease activity A